MITWKPFALVALLFLHPGVAFRHTTWQKGNTRRLSVVNAQGKNLHGNNVLIRNDTPGQSRRRVDDAITRANISAVKTPLTTEHVHPAFGTSVATPWQYSSPTAPTPLFTITMILLFFAFVSSTALCGSFTGICVKGKGNASKMPSVDNIKTGTGKCIYDVSSLDIQKVNTPNAYIIQPEWTRESVREILQEHTDLSKWSDHMVESLARELSAGRGRLVMHESRLVYEEHLCLLFVVNRRIECMILEFGDDENPQSVSTSNGGEKVPMCQVLADESLYEAAHRCLQEKLEISGDFARIARDSLFHIREAKSYRAELPGLPCVDRKYFVLATVEAIGETTVKRVGLDDGFLEVHGRRYTWKTIRGCMHLDKRFRAWLRHPNNCVDSPSSEQTLVDHMVLPWTETAVNAILQKHNVASPLQTFAKTVKDLTQLLKDGKVALATCPVTGELVCLEDYVVCVIKTPEGLTFPESNLDSDFPEMDPDFWAEPGVIAGLPSIKKLSCESAWQAALRCLHGKDLSQPSLQLSEEVYSSGHSGLVQIANLNHDVLAWPMDERTPKCHLRLFLIEGEIKNAADISDAFCAWEGEAFPYC